MVEIVRELFAHGAPPRAALVIGRYSPQENANEAKRRGHKKVIRISRQNCLSDPRTAAFTAADEKDCAVVRTRQRGNESKFCCNYAVGHDVFKSPRSRNATVKTFISAATSRGGAVNLGTATAPRWWGERTYVHTAIRRPHANKESLRYRPTTSIRTAVRRLIVQHYSVCTHPRQVAHDGDGDG